MSTLDNLFKKYTYENDIYSVSNIAYPYEVITNLKWNLDISNEDWETIRENYDLCVFSCRVKVSGPYLVSSKSKYKYGSLTNGAGCYISKQYSDEKGLEEYDFNITADPIRRRALHNVSYKAEHYNNRNIPTDDLHSIWNYTDAASYPSRLSANVKIGNYYFTNADAESGSIYTKDSDVNSTSVTKQLSYFDTPTFSVSTLKIARGHGWYGTGWLQEFEDGYVDAIFAIEFISYDNSKKRYEIFSPIYRITRNSITLSPIN